MQESVRQRVYSNLAKFLEHRNLEFGSTSKDSKMPKNWMKIDDFIQTIQLDGYIMFEAHDSEKKMRRFHKSVPPAVHKLPVRTFVILIDSTSGYSKASNDFMKLLGRIPEFNSKKRKSTLDIIVITKEMMKSNVTNKYNPHINHGSLGDDDKTVFGATYISNYPYRVFTSVIPDSKFVPHHRIVTKEEEVEILEQIHTDKKDLPKIRQLDPPMIWLGGTVGDVVECLLPSENTGYEKKYLVVIPN